MMTTEKRSEGRVPYTEKIEYYLWDKRNSAIALEISGDGMFLRTGEVVNEGSMLTLRLRLPGQSRAFTVLAQVVHVVLGSRIHARGMGLKFLDIAPRDREAIRGYVAGRPRLLAA